MKSCGCGGGEIRGQKRPPARCKQINQKKKMKEEKKKKETCVFFFFFFFFKIKIFWFRFVFSLSSFSSPPPPSLSPAKTTKTTKSATVALYLKQHRRQQVLDRRAAPVQDARQLPRLAHQVVLQVHPQDVREGVDVDLARRGLRDGDPRVLPRVVEQAHGAPAGPALEVEGGEVGDDGRDEERAERGRRRGLAASRGRVRGGVGRGEAVDEVGVARWDGEVGDAGEDEEDDAGGGAGLVFFFFFFFLKKKRVGIFFSFSQTWKKNSFQLCEAETFSVKKKSPDAPALLATRTRWPPRAARSTL